MHKKEIIPTLFALERGIFKKKLDLISTFSKKIHIDFMDGKFTQNSSIVLNDMDDILNYKNIEFEIHLMAYEPEQYIGKIKKLGIKKVLIHFEVFETNTELTYSIESFREKGLEVFLVLNPSTDVEEAFPYIDEVNGIMLMSVWPGMQGQKFIENSYKKIEKLRENYPKVLIQLDGGISDINAKKLLQSRVNILSVGSYISSNINPENSFQLLNSIIKDTSEVKLKK